MKNSNYRETDKGLFRREDAPDAQHKSRIDWNLVNVVKEIKQGVSELREQQNQRNEEYRKNRGS